MPTSLPAVLYPTAVTVTPSGIKNPGQKVAFSLGLALAAVEVHPDTCPLILPLIAYCWPSEPVASASSESSPAFTPLSVMVASNATQCLPASGALDPALVDVAGSIIRTNVTVAVSPPTSVTLNVSPRCPDFAVELGAVVVVPPDSTPVFGGPEPVETDVEGVVAPVPVFDELLHPAALPSASKQAHTPSRARRRWYKG